MVRKHTKRPPRGGNSRQQSFRYEVVLVIGTISAWLVTRAVTKPPDEAVAAADLVGHGDLRQTIAFAGRSKTGNVLHALQSMSGKRARVVSNERSTAS